VRFTVGASPVAHLVADGFADPRPDWSVPPAGDPSWEVEYDSECERGKRALRRLGGWAAGVAEAMRDPQFLWRLSCFFGEDLFPDDSLWGGGLQAMCPGSFLGCHLDGVLHPKRPGLRRAVQIVCFCHQSWEPGWGGQFAFFNPAGRPIQSYAALPGRLLAFDCSSDLAYHGVLPTAEGATDRVSVACSLLAPARPCDTRERALFLPRRRRAGP
jgi:hypothetical protein